MQNEKTYVQFGRGQRTPEQFVAALFEMLQKHPLDPTFEDYGNFFSVVKSSDFGPENQQFAQAWEGGYHILGNFHDRSWVFGLYTKDEELAKRLEAAIRENQQTPAYAAAVQDWKAFQEMWRNARAKLPAAASASA